MIFDEQPMPQFYAGLDLGQATQYTGFAILERADHSYAVRHLERWPVGTAYADIVSGVVQRTRALGPKVALAVDATGVGRPVIRILHNGGLRCRGHVLTITQNQAARPGPYGPCVPKKDLVATLQVLLQTRRFTVSTGLPDAPLLAAELNTFSAKASMADTDLMDWRERPHDDLVLAVAIAAWLGENLPEPYTGPLVYTSKKNAKDVPKKTIVQKVLEQMDYEDEMRDRGRGSILR